MEDHKKIINWRAVSKLLSGGPEGVRSNYSGKKYREAINELTGFTRGWLNKYTNPVPVENNRGDEFSGITWVWKFEFDRSDEKYYYFNFLHMENTELRCEKSKCILKAELIPGEKYNIVETADIEKGESVFEITKQ